MEKQLKDYLHFYLGQEAEGFWDAGNGIVESEGVGQILGIDVKDIDTDRGPVCLYLPIRKHSPNKSRRHFKFTEVAPILRPLSDMTGEEAIALYCAEPWYHVSKSHITAAIIMPNANGYQPNIIEIHHSGPSGASGYCTGTDLIYLNKLSPRQFAFLLSRGFDLFGLIESQLAIDKTQQQHKEGGV